MNYLSLPTRQWAPIVWAGVGFFALARFGSVFGLTGVDVDIPFWPASAFGLMVAIKRERFGLLAIGVGSFFAAFLQLNLAAACIVAAGDIMAAGFGAWVYAKTDERFAWLGSRRAPTALLAAAIISSSASGLLSCSALAALFNLSAANAFELRLNWWLGDAVAILTLTPLLLLVSQRSLGSVASVKNALRLVTLLLVATGAVWVAAQLPGNKGVIFLPFFLIFTAHRNWGELWGRISTLISVVALLVAVRYGGLAVASGGPQENRVALAMLIAGLSVLGFEAGTHFGPKLRQQAVPIFVIGGFLAARIYGHVDQLIQSRTEARVRERVELVSHSLVDSIENFVEALRPAGYFFASGQRMNLPRWQEYVADLKLEKHYPGLRGIGVAFPVQGDQTESYFANCRTWLTPIDALWSFSGERLLPAGSGERFYYALTFFHPVSPGVRSVGLDLASDPARKAAADLARDTGEPQMSRPLILLMDGVSGLPGHLIFYPVYTQGKAIETVEQRRQAFVCWLMGGFTDQSAFSAVPGIQQDGVSFSIRDDDSAFGGKPIFSREAPILDPQALVSRRVNAFSILGRKYTLDWRLESPQRTFEQANAMGLSVLLVLASALIGSIIIQLRDFGHRANRLVEERTKDLEMTNVHLRVKEAEARRLALVATAAQNPIFVTDGELRIEWVNPSFTAFYGYSLEEISGQKPRDFLRGRDSNPDPMGDSRQKFFERNEAVSYEILHYTKADRKRWVSLSVRPVLDQAGKMEKVVGVVTDLSQRKEFERNLQAATQAAEKANEAKSALIANVSHELRTPLNVIIGNLQLLQGGVFGPVPTAQASAWKGVQDSSHHLLRLIGDLLDISKVSAGMMELELGPVNIRELGDQVVGMMNPSAKLKQLNLVARYRHRTAVIEGDELRLKQILINLLSNAVKFTPAGGTITLEVSETENPQELAISVTDTGRGIALEDHERVFLEFEQGEHVGHSGGTGLGLPIARRLAVMHGGNITLASETGRGSTFTVRLPVRIPSAAAQPPEPLAPEPKLEEPAVSPPGSALILAVDDSPDNLEILYFYLSSEGFRVKQASSGEEAIVQAAKLKPDMILMDVKMSGMDGLEAIRRLKADPATSGIPVISLTAFATKADVERCHDAGAADYVSKPIDFEELSRKINRHLAPARSV